MPDVLHKGNALRASKRLSRILEESGLQRRRPAKRAATAKQRTIIPKRRRPFR
jgi:hypothetical protein